MDDVTLTRTERFLLGILAFRRTLGDCWLVHAGRGRDALIVPTMLEGAPLERHSAYNTRDTLRNLGRRKLIEWGSHEPAPAYAGRRRGESSTAEKVWITDAGLALIPTSQGGTRG